jgi:hypothetical protein
MQAKKVAGRQGPGGWSGEMDPKTRAAAAVANALFIFLLSKPHRKLPPKAKRHAHSQLAIRLCCDFLNAWTALLIPPARTGDKPIGRIVPKRGNDIRIHTRDIRPTVRRVSRPSSCRIG